MKFPLVEMAAKVYGAMLRDPKKRLYKTLSGEWTLALPGDKSVDKWNENLHCHDEVVNYLMRKGRVRPRNKGPVLTIVVLAGCGSYHAVGVR